MAPTVQKDANGNTICRRDSQGRKIACAKCIKGHRTSMCKPSHTDGVQVIDGVGRKQGTKDRRKNGQPAVDMFQRFLDQAKDGARVSDDQVRLQSLPQRQAAYLSGESTPQAAQRPQFPTQPQLAPDWVAPVPWVGPYPQMQVNQPAGNFVAAPVQQQQQQQQYRHAMVQHFAEPGAWHDPMHQMQAHQPFGYVEPGFGHLMQMQEPQPPADIQGRGFMAHGRWAPKPLEQGFGAAMNGVPLHQNITPSQHPVQAPELDYLANHEQFDERFPLNQETLERGLLSLLQQPAPEMDVQ